MKITELVLHPIAIADPPLRSSYGLHAPFALRTIVELKTDSGLTGFSETYGGDGPLAGLESVRSRVVGMDPFQLAALWRDLSREAGHAMANAAAPNAALRYNRIRGREASPAALVLTLSIHPRFGTLESRLIPKGSAE